MQGKTSRVSEKGEWTVELVDLSNVSLGLFVTGVIFILAIGSFLSLGALRFFQHRKGQGGMYMALSALSLVALIWIVNTWFA
jgi:hypothetical protein